MAIKRVAVEGLRPGMFIHDLRCSYLRHGFLRSRFELKDESQIQQLRKLGIPEVDIDTERGRDVEVPPKVEREVSPPTGPGPRVAQREESAVARKILGEAQTVVQGLFNDIRLGRQMDTAMAGPVVEEISGSVLRNPGAMLSLSRIKDADTYTFQHSVSVCALLVAFCNGMGMDSALVREAGIGGLLHDMGKMRVPPEILNKPGKLTDSEFVIMRSHASMSRELLEGIPGISEQVIQIADEHHEKVGGGGYPTGMAGEGISLLGRMAAIVDVYDAITSNRCYHKGMEPSAALTKLLEWSGTHLDEVLVQRFIRILGIYPVGSLVRLESDRLAVVVEQEEDRLRPTVRVVYDSQRQVRLQPRDLCLIGASDSIKSFEEPSAWGLDPREFLCPPSP